MLVDLILQYSVIVFYIITACVYAVNRDYKMWSSKHYIQLQVWPPVHKEDNPLGWSEPVLGSSILFLTVNYPCTQVSLASSHFRNMQYYSSDQQKAREIYYRDA